MSGNNTKAPAPPPTAQSVANQRGTISAGHGSSGVQNAPKPTKEEKKQSYAQYIDSLTPDQQDALFAEVMKKKQGKK
jgi:hypothetical protein